MHKHLPYPFPQVPVDPLFKRHRLHRRGSRSQFGGFEQSVQGDQLFGLRELGDVVLVRVFGVPIVTLRRIV
jgi:hypothetical protein